MDSLVGSQSGSPRKVSQNGPIYSSKHLMPQLLDDGCEREFTDRELAAIERTTLEGTCTSTFTKSRPNCPVPCGWGWPWRSPAR
jgi:hypothetical protein